MKQLIKRLLTNDKKTFAALCATNGVALDYRLNRDGRSAFNEVFIQREYADGFPFYSQATVVDIGAHYGYFSLFAARNLADTARIIAVEPAPENAAVIRKNCSSSGITNIELVECAIGVKAGRQALYGGRSVNRSLVNDYALGNRDAATDQVDVITLEELLDRSGIERVDFLKLDCEGAEYGILNTATDTLLQRIGCISLEFHDLKRPGATGLDLVKRLKAAGFELLHFNHSPTSMNLNYGRIVVWRSKENTY